MLHGDYQHVWNIGFSFQSECLDECTGMILQRSGSCDGRAHIIIPLPEAAYRGGCGECPLSSIDMRITEVGMMNRSGSEVTEEETLHVVEYIYCGILHCCVSPSGTETNSL